MQIGFIENRKKLKQYEQEAFGHLNTRTPIDTNIDALSRSFIKLIEGLFYLVEEYNPDVSLEASLSTSKILLGVNINGEHLRLIIESNYIPEISKLLEEDQIFF